MPIRIRVYPQYGRRNNFGGNGNLRFNHARQRVNMQLRYERAIYAERLRSMQVQAQLRYGGVSGYGQNAYSPYGQLGINSAAYGAGYLPMGGYGYGNTYASGYGSTFAGGSGYGNSYAGQFGNFFRKFC